MTVLALAVGGRGLVDPSEPVLHADDEAFLRGRAAFETIRVYDGRPFRLDDHLDRLAGSAGRLGLPAVDAVGFRGIVREALDASGEPNAVLRLYITPGREGVGAKDNGSFRQDRVGAAAGDEGRELGNAVAFRPVGHGLGPHGAGGVATGDEGRVVRDLLGRGLESGGKDFRPPAAGARFAAPGGGARKQAEDGEPQWGSFMGCVGF